MSFQISKAKKALREWLTSPVLQGILPLLSLTILVVMAFMKFSSIPPPPAV